MASARRRGQAKEAAVKGRQAKDPETDAGDVEDLTMHQSVIRDLMEDKCEFWQLSGKYRM